MSFARSVESNGDHRDKMSGVRSSLVNQNTRTQADTDSGSSDDWSSILRSESGLFSAIEPSRYQTVLTGPFNGTVTAASIGLTRLGQDKIYEPIKSELQHSIWNTIVSLLQTYWTTARDAAPPEAVARVS